MEPSTGPNPAYRNSRNDSAYLEDTYVLYELDLPSPPRPSPPRGRAQRPPSTRHKIGESSNEKNTKLGKKTRRINLKKITMALWVLFVISVGLAIVSLIVAIATGTAQQTELSRTNTRLRQETHNLHNSLMELQNKYDQLRDVVMTLGDFNLSRDSISPAMNNCQTTQSNQEGGAIADVFEMCRENVVEAQSGQASTNRIYSHTITTEFVPFNITGFYTVDIRCEIDYQLLGLPPAIDTSHVTRSSNSVACTCGFITFIDEQGLHTRLGSLPSYTCRMVIKRCPFGEQT